MRILRKLKIQRLVEIKVPRKMMQILKELTQENFTEKKGVVGLTAFINKDDIIKYTDYRYQTR